MIASKIWKTGGNAEILKEKMQLENEHKEMEIKKFELLEEKAQSAQKHEELVQMYKEQVNKNREIQKDKIEQLQNYAALLKKNKELQTKTCRSSAKNKFRNVKNLKKSYKRPSKSSGNSIKCKFLKKN